MYAVSADEQRSLNDRGRANKFSGACASFLMCCSLPVPALSLSLFTLKNSGCPPLFTLFAHRPVRRSRKTRSARLGRRALSSAHAARPNLEGRYLSQVFVLAPSFFQEPRARSIVPASKSGRAGESRMLRVCEGRTRSEGSKGPKRVRANELPCAHALSLLSLFSLRVRGIALLTGRRRCARAWGAAGAGRSRAARGGRGGPTRGPPRPRLRGRNQATG